MGTTSREAFSQLRRFLDFVLFALSFPFSFSILLLFSLSLLLSCSLLALARYGVSLNMETSAVKPESSQEEVDDEYDGSTIIDVQGPWHLLFGTAESGDENYDEDELFIGEKDLRDEARLAEDRKNQLKEKIGGAGLDAQRPVSKPIATPSGSTKLSSSTGSFQEPKPSIREQRTESTKLAASPQLRSSPSDKTGETEFAAMFAKVRGQGSFSDGSTEPRR